MVDAKVARYRKSNLEELQERLRSIDVNVLDFFQYLRLKWMKRETRQEDVLYIEKALHKSVDELIEIKLRKTGNTKWMKASIFST